MKPYNTSDLSSSPAFERLESFVQKSRVPGALKSEDFEAFQIELHEQVAALEAEITGQVMSQFDLDADEIDVDGEVWRKVLRCEEDYVCPAGDVRVNRTLYTRKDRGEGPG